MDNILQLCISDAIWQMSDQLDMDNVLVDNNIMSDETGEIQIEGSTILKYEIKNQVMTKIYASEKY